MEVSTYAWQLIASYASCGVMLPATRVVLWAAPKTVSTAFERSMRTLDYCKVLHEPYVGPCYIREQQYSSRRQDSCLTELVMKKPHLRNLVKDYPFYEAVFVKELAKHVEGNLDEVMQGGLSTYTHTRF